MVEVVAEGVSPYRLTCFCPFCNVFVVAAGVILLVSRAIIRVSSFAGRGGSPCAACMGERGLRERRFNRGSFFFHSCGGEWGWHRFNSPLHCSFFELNFALVCSLVLFIKRDLGLVEVPRLYL